MSISKAKSRAEYIENLQLAIPEASLNSLPPAELTLVENKDSAKVVGGSTISFISGVPKIKQADVLNSTLLAQLGANYAFDRVTQTEQWYNKYVEVLENIGWVISSFKFAHQALSGVTVEMDKAALDILAAAISGDELAVLTATLKALKDANPGSKSITLFDTNGSSQDGGNFQLGTASEDPTGNVQMSMGAFYFQASERHTRFLFWSWSTKSINMFAGSESILLNEDIYSTVRQQIINKLGPRAVTYVADLPI
ncbi:hypothetical protein J0X14_15160 [Muricauda sp. CAU 1633]|uniref:hypothetical protein n=1 Tax=Allomuricauda sp. CAU 1633 TaxID=2816036 RepID=UPI001A8D7C1C|nr:hypothetical protein [Muricauda sp. CAU 1633]MBO0323648.1 hypothetical protein [Muricauda sp. CAU 1633]